MPADSNASDQPAVAPPPSRLSRVLAYRLLLGLVLAVFALDQLTKAWINARMPLGSYGPYALSLIHISEPTRPY